MGETSIFSDPCFRSFTQILLNLVFRQVLRTKSNVQCDLRLTHMYARTMSFNLLPNDKILDKSKLEAFADDKLNIAKMTSSLFDGVENTVGKGENAGHQHFLLFPQCFPKPSSEGSLKIGILW